MSYRILIVEDEASIGNLIKTNLRLEAYEAELCDTGEKAIKLLKTARFDLIVLDVMLPDSDGKNICRLIKSFRSDLPVLMLSALDQSSDRVSGLKSGADDYLGKPFDLEELLLRIRNLLARSNQPIIEAKLSIGNCTIDLDRSELSRGDDVFKLSSTEAKLLRFMFENEGKTLSRQQLLDSVWGYQVFPNTRSIDNFISSLRKMVEPDPSRPKYIETIRGIGYRLQLN